MTVGTTTPKITYIYTGPGSYAYAFTLTSDVDVQVSHLDGTTGLETLLVLTTDYTVSRAVDNLGGTIVTSYAPTSGTLIIRRKITIQQLVDWVNNSELDVEILEGSFDKLTMILQEQNLIVEEGSTGILSKGVWSTSVAYSMSDVVQYPTAGDSYYICEESHTSGTWATDLASGLWRVFIDFSVLSANAGGLVNIEDLNNVATPIDGFFPKWDSGTSSIDWEEVSQRTSISGVDNVASLGLVTSAGIADLSGVYSIPLQTGDNITVWIAGSIDLQESAVRLLNRNAQVERQYDGGGYDAIGFIRNMKYESQTAGANLCRIRSNFTSVFTYNALSTGNMDIKVTAAAGSGDIELVSTARIVWTIRRPL